LYFLDTERHAATLNDCAQCLATLETVAPATGAAYYDVIPLVSTRLLQLQVYAWVHSNRTHVPEFARLASKRAALAEQIDPKLARSGLKRRQMDVALANYGECKRSGRFAAKLCPAGSERIPRHPYPDHGAAGLGDAAASLLVHLHLTFHGGTNLLRLIKRNSCAMLPHFCAGISNKKIRWERTTLLNLTANRSICSWTPCGRDRNVAKEATRSSDPRNHPIDVAFFEPFPPPSLAWPDKRWAAANIDSARYLFTSIARNPAFFVAERGISTGLNPEFMLEKWASKHYRGMSCHLSHAKNSKDARTPPPRCAMGAKWANDGELPCRDDLELAKDLARSFSVLILFEEMNEGLAAFSAKLGWGPHWHAEPHRQKANDSHRNVILALANQGLRRKHFAELVDASQLSTELYYFVRELNRAWHVELNLTRPSTALAPPHELQGIVF